MIQQYLFEPPDTHCVEFPAFLNNYEIAGGGMCEYSDGSFAYYQPPAHVHYGKEYGGGYGYGDMRSDESDIRANKGF